MTEGRPTTPTRRPATARPRPDPSRERPEPPSPEELAAIERHLVELARLSGARVEADRSGALLVLHPAYGLGLNYATQVRWSEGDWEERLADAADRLAALGERPQLLVAEGSTTPPGLAQRLLASGWRRIATETVLWTRRAAVVPHLDPSLRIEAVTSASAALYEQVEREIFGVPGVLADERTRRLVEATEAGAVRAYLVRLAGEPVATARLSSFEGLAALHGIGVVEGHRRKGLGTLATAVATRAGLATGARLVWLSVAPDNEPAVRLYAALDFQQAFGWHRLVDPGTA